MERDHLTAAIYGVIEHHRNLIHKMEKEIEGLPKGSIYHRKIRDVSRFYRYQPSGKPNGLGRQQYLRQDRHELTGGLLRKKHLKESLKVLYKNLEAARTFVQRYRPYCPTSIANELWSDFTMNDFVKFAQQSSPLDQGAWAGGKWTDGKRTDGKWTDENDERCTLYPEQLLYFTPGGVRVRSKSESIIAGLLESSGIPYKYEARLDLGGQIYYPDFTVLSQQDGQIKYWEHFGMVGNANYEFSMDKKIAAYRVHDIVQWDNLIVTYETQMNPLNSLRIQQLIKAFLLAD